MSNTSTKSVVTMISLTRAEGPIVCCGKVDVFGSEDNLDLIWDRAQHQLTIWGYTAPEGGGYDKCDVVVHWANGETLKTRYDLVRGGLTDGGIDLRRSISNVVRLYAGEWCPEHLEKHIHHLLARSPDFTEATERVWATCHV